MKFKNYIYSIVIVLVAWFPCHGAEAPKLVVGTGNPGGVRSVAYSPDGRFAVSGSTASPVLKLWEISTGREIRTFKSQSSGPGGIYSVAFSPDGRSILSGGDFLEMWDITTGSRIRTFCKNNCEMYRIMSVAFSGDGQYVLSGAWFNTLYLWNAETGEFIRAFSHADPESSKAHSVNINSVALSSDGRFAVSGGDDATIKLWDVETGKQLRTLTGHSKRVTTVALSPDDRFLLSGGKKKIKLWEVATGKLIRTFGGLFASQNYVVTLQFSPDGQWALSTNNNGEMIYWDVSAGKALHVFNKGEEKKKVAACAIFSPDGRFALQGHKGVMKLWDLTHYRLVKEMKGHADPIRALTFAPKDNMVLTATNYTFKYWNFQTGREIRSFQGEGSGPVFITPDGKSLFSATRRQTAVLRDGATGRILKEFDKISAYKPGVALSPNGRYGLWFRDREAFLWDLRSGKKIHTLKGHDDLVTRVVFSPDSGFALTGGETGTLNLWEVSSGRHLRTFLTKDQGPTGTVLALAFSPEGRYVLSGTLDAKVRLWEVNTGKLVRVMEGKTEWLGDIAYSPDGTRALAGGSGMTIKMWDCETGGILATFTGHSSGVYTLIFSADGRYALSGGRDGVIKLYDIKRKKELASRVHIDEKDWVVYTPDGRFDGSPEGIRHVHFVQGLETYPLEAFYEKFYTPNLWVRIFDETPFPATEVHIAREITAPPRVEIISPRSGTVMDSERASLEVAIEDQGGGIDEIRLYQNGKLVSDLTRGIRIKETTGHQTTHRFDILLISGKNEFKVVALNTNRTESKPAVVTVAFKRRSTSSAASLYILAIGINKYKNAVYDLNFGRPDAEAFTRALENQGRAIFAQIVKREVYDEKAIKPVIEQEIKHIIDTAGPEDVLAFFYAGHGVMSLDNEEKGSDFYLVTHDVTQLYGKRELLESKGISARQLKEWLKKIPAQKQVIILDACQAGGAVETFALRGAAEQKAIAQLARSTGTVVLASSGSEQYASELPELGHGLFTYAFLQAIAGHADGGKPPDGKITIKEIEAYINDRVPELTQRFRGSAQYPNSYTIGHDFPLAMNLKDAGN
ncbi:MAG: caspase family protein [Desulfobacterales bacterium]|jgi:WD40 repeat protein